MSHKYHLNYYRIEFGIEGKFHPSIEATLTNQKRKKSLCTSMRERPIAFCVSFDHHQWLRKPTTELPMYMLCAWTYDLTSNFWSVSIKTKRGSLEEIDLDYWKVKSMMDA